MWRVLFDRFAPRDVINLVLFRVPIFGTACRPNIVQAVRSVDDRAIASDLTWTPEYERRDKIADYYSSPGRLPPWIYNQ